MLRIRKVRWKRFLMECDSQQLESSTDLKCQATVVDKTLV